MNEQRPQAYLNLINQLLSWKESDEPRILQENEDLLDEGLIEVMIAVAQQLGEAGRENEAQWLISIAQQLAQALGLLDNATTETANTPQDYLNFLMEILQKISENPNPQVIYPFWAQNLDQLDENLIYILDNWAKNTLSSVKAEEAVSIAGVIVTFSNLIQQFPLGNIAINEEIAITGYQIALSILTFDAFPQQWATTQNNLGLAYIKRIRGDKAENLEKAIAAYTEALKVYTFDAFPQDWAMTQHNLALAYLCRIRGDKAENLEQAIAAYTEALKVCTFDAFPEKWATIQNNLAIAYSKRVRGDQAENLEQAIAACTEALKVYTFDAFPQDWAMTQNNLALAYSHRIRGDKADNLEKAIAAYTEALKVYTFDAFPQDWAMTQNNLAATYSDRIRGDKAENLEKAIAACTEALKVLPFDAFPEKWAMTQNNLAANYSGRIRGDKAENLEKAIAAYTEALKVLTFDAFPEKWAMTQNNLAIAYSERIKGDKAENIELAISCYKNALKGYESGGDSFQAAKIGLILGKIYVEQGHWYKGLDYLEKSWQKYRLLDSFKGLADVTYQIAHTHHLIGNFEKASVNYRDALRFYEYLNNDRGVAFCKASLGRLILQFAPVEEAKKYLEQAQKIFIDINEQSQVTEIENILQYLKEIKEKQTV